ncbi:MULTISPECIES: HAMP domain-containing protein [Sorangium]|uniref:HAMP domain-containing protein n=1 Tax=Sorangium TaxID=39643 RepID=UPI003D9C2D98
MSIRTGLALIFAVAALGRAWIDDERLREGEAQAQQAKDERLRRMRVSFARIAGDMDEVTRRASAGERWVNRRFVEAPEREYERGFVPRTDAAIADARRDVARSTEEAGLAGAQIRRDGGALMAAALGILVVLLGGLLRTMARGFSALTGCARRIAAGDLTSTVPDLGKHEFGRMGAALRHMAEGLREAQESRLRVERLAAIGQLAASVGHEPWTTCPTSRRRSWPGCGRPGCAPRRCTTGTRPSSAPGTRRSTCACSTS